MGSSSDYFFASKYFTILCKELGGIIFYTTLLFQCKLCFYNKIGYEAHEVVLHYKCSVKHEGESIIEIRAHKVRGEHKLDFGNACPLPAVFARCKYQCEHQNARFYVFG
jgi:hypothetical protein